MGDELGFDCLASELTPITTAGLHEQSGIRALQGDLRSGTWQGQETLPQRTREIGLRNLPGHGIFRAGDYHDQSRI